MMKKILIVDDDAGIRTVVRRYLIDSGLSVVATDNGSDGLLLVREARPDLILVDATWKPAPRAAGPRKNRMPELEMEDRP